jgi:hypothetical protein
VPAIVTGREVADVRGLLPPTPPQTAIWNASHAVGIGAESPLALAAPEVPPRNPTPLARHAPCRWPQNSSGRSTNLSASDHQRLPFTMIPRVPSLRHQGACLAGRMGTRGRNHGTARVGAVPSPQISFSSRSVGFLLAGVPGAAAPGVFNFLPDSSEHFPAAAWSITRAICENNLLTNPQE